MVTRSPVIAPLGNLLNPCARTTCQGTCTADDVQCCNFFDTTIHHHQNPTPSFSFSHSYDLTSRRTLLNHGFKTSALNSAAPAPSIRSYKKPSSIRSSSISSRLSITRRHRIYNFFLPAPPRTHHPSPPSKEATKRARYQRRSF